MATVTAIRTKQGKGIVQRTKDLGGWFIFFLVIYAILILKVVTYQPIHLNLFFGFYSVAVTAYIFSRFFLSYFHKSIPFDENYQPTVSFVVPVKDEEAYIAQTVDRFVQSHYPRENMEIVVVNDGSTDSTLRELQAAKERIGGAIPMTIIDWRENRGKREAMAAGAHAAKNEIIIFVDSDSFIDAECVRHLVKYFPSKDVGAVSGHTDVYNESSNLLTRMQSMRYYVCFKIFKAAESFFGVVTCCPGCCSAYRREYLMEFLDEWLNQTFLGDPCTFGDDRSLTNFIIRKHIAVYSPEAKAATVVPDTFSKYLKQQQRWKKSWVRETLVASSFMWRKDPLAALSFYLYIFVAFASPIVFFRALVYLPYLRHTWPLAYLLGLFVMLFMYGWYYKIATGRQAWLMTILSFWFNSVILMWQLPWAIITIKDSRWGTR